MAEPSSDPPDARALFSPVRDAYREASSDAPGPADTPVSSSDGATARARTNPPRQRVAFVELPTLSSNQKTKYRSVAEDTLNSDEEFAHDGIERILGEEEDGPLISYYVRYNDGIVHKVSIGVYLHWSAVLVWFGGTMIRKPMENELKDSS